MTTKSHRKRVRHFQDEGHLHELTFSCYRRMPLLTNDVSRGIPAESLQAACTTEDFGLVAFVFTPEHVHPLVVPLAPTSDVSRLLARTKQPASKQIKQRLVEANAKLVEKLTICECPGKYCFRFWQEGQRFDRNTFSPEAISSSIDCIHMNPVKRGLCEKAVDWTSSSG